MKRILIACEYSGRVRSLFRAAGFDAWSCDIIPAEDAGPHLLGDVREFLDQGWDAMIAFPPCTFLCTSGLHWITRGRVEKDGRSRALHHAEALDFVRLLLGAPIEFIALENPSGAIGSKIRGADQSIQPYQFGDDASKCTCLWLKNLPPIPIDPALYVLPRAVCQNEECGAVELVRKSLEDGCIECGSRCLPRWANQTDSGQNAMTPSKTRGKDRALTYDGIARAMTSTWAPVISK